MEKPRGRGKTGEPGEVEVASQGERRPVCHVQQEYGHMGCQEHIFPPRSRGCGAWTKKYGKTLCPGEG